MFLKLQISYGKRYLGSDHQAMRSESGDLLFWISIYVFMYSIGDLSTQRRGYQDEAYVDIGGIT